MFFLPALRQHPEFRRGFMDMSFRGTGHCRMGLDDRCGHGQVGHEYG